MSTTVPNSQRNSFQRLGPVHPPSLSVIDQLGLHIRKPDALIVAAWTLMNPSLSVARQRPRPQPQTHSTKTVPDDVEAFAALSPGLRSYLSSQELLSRIETPDAFQVKMGHSVHTIDPPPRDTALEAAVHAMAARLYAEGRERAIEIAAQDRHLELMFALSIGAGAPPDHPDAAPNTLAVIDAVSLVAAWPLYRAKYLLRVRRPNVVDPSITPLITTPPHASYPSGHATAAFALAEVLASLTGAQSGSDIRSALFLLAERIADNRECAGLHTTSDTAAGRALGTALGQWMAAAAVNHPDENPMWALLFSNASTEWTTAGVRP